MVIASPSDWNLRDRTFNWGDRTYVMGVLNVTPDSFSDGGQFNTLETAIVQAQHLITAGVDMLDIGGQSTRPGARQIPIEEELRRVVPVVEAIRHSQDIGLAQAVISVDTTQSEVARLAVKAGADLINDISGGTYDAAMFATVADLGVPIILMHIRGTPDMMQKDTNYSDLIGEIYDFLERQTKTAQAAGLRSSQIAIDPGIGFGKSYTQNLEILRQVSTFRQLNYPILIGPSRKSFLGWLLQQPDPQERAWGTAAACCAAIAGGADILRVHDSKEIIEVCKVADAIWRQRLPDYCRNSD
ncbi:dihydropteroate synthase [Oscillatoria sp. CS-180]|uniref:dihydropteroate synthase n=1 Tax=Oscillatoria sp. CS-180 TaxID=3021720 RepID=UPI002330E5E5|nr:dihydropteroate synthase [Oscillatoria sp. CS-180]MDB9528203.1 dihydropteroate synthase [Oscillatoria sp. CS-180]